MIATTIRGTESYGWIPPELRSDEETYQHVTTVREMPTWDLVGDDWGTEKACLWDIARKAHGGKDIDTLAQATGSCVGNGAWNAVMYLMAFEIVRKGDPEEVKTIFLPYHYGRGRLHSGIRGRGDGSIGSGQAKAVRVDGVIAQDASEELPKPTNREGLSWGSKVEYEWSAGERIENEWIEKGRLHPVGATAQMRSAADVKAALCNGYPVTIASDWGGMMSPPVKDGVLLNRRVTRWMHQMAVLAWWKHPTHGDIYWIQNSWGRNAHGKCPSGAPAGGFWVKAEEIDYITRQGDSFSFSDLAGFPRREIDWGLV